MSRIFRRLLLYFGVSMLIMSLILTSIFSLLFSNYSKELYQKELLERGEKIAVSLAELVDGRNRGMQKQGGLGAYLNFIDDIAMTDVWILEIGDVWVRRSHHTQEINYRELPTEVEALIEEVLKGTSLTSQSFSQVFDQAHISVGVPIIKDGAVLGGVFLHGPVEGLEEAGNYQRKLLLFSALLGLFISLPLAWHLSLKFTRPLDLMKVTALGLARGDYSLKNQMNQKDEIGELAQAIDLLSERLDQAKKRQEEEEERERVFLANISHELKTPVTVIRSSLEALKDGLVDDEDKTRLYYEQMLAESLQLEMLIKDLLELAKLRSSKLTLTKEPISMVDLIKDLVLSMESMAREKDIDLVYESAEEYKIFGDYGRLRQMITIVLENALKFSPQGAQVRIEESLENDNYRLIIVDQGPGFSKEDLELAFDRFHSSYFRTGKEGSGLGLTIAKELAQAQGFSIKIDSQVNKTRVIFVRE